MASFLEAVKLGMGFSLGFIIIYIILIVLLVLFVTLMNPATSAPALTTTSVTSSFNT